MRALKEHFTSIGAVTNLWGHQEALKAAKETNWMYEIVECDADGVLVRFHCG